MRRNRTNEPGDHRRLDLADLEPGRVVEVVVEGATYWLTPIVAASLDHHTRTILTGVAVHASDGSVKMLSPFNIGVHRVLRCREQLLLSYAGREMTAAGNNRRITAIRVLEGLPQTQELNVELNRMRAHADTFDLGMLPPGSVVTLSDARARQVYLTTVRNARSGHGWVQGVFVQTNWRQITLPSPYDSMTTQLVGAGLHPHYRTLSGQPLLLADHVIAQSLNNPLP